MWEYILRKYKIPRDWIHVVTNKQLIVNKVYNFFVQYEDATYTKLIGCLT